MSPLNIPVNAYKFFNKKHVDKLFSNFNYQQLYVISFPGFHKENLVIQTILGHELGHPIASEYLDQESKEYKFEISEEVEISFKKDLEKAPSLDKRDELKVDIIDNILTIRDGFIVEIIADLVAYSLFSFGFLFSIVNFFNSSSDLDNPDIEIDGQNPNIHPAWRTRLRFILDDVAKQDFTILDRALNDCKIEEKSHQEVAKRIKEQLSNFTTIVEKRTDEEILNSNPLLKIAYCYVKKEIPKVFQWINNRVHRYDFSNNYQDIIKCIVRLHERIPPNAILERNITDYKNISLQTILVSGNIYKEVYLSSIEQNQIEKFIEESDQINQLMLKAIELSMISEKYRRHNYKKIIFRQF